MRAYEECPVDHWSKKREKTVEEKCKLAAEYTKQFGNTAMLLLTKIFCKQDVGMLKQFLEALHFINNFFKSFAHEYFSTLIYPSNIIRDRQEYLPSLVDSYQHDCQALLSDISGFSKRIEPYLFSCKTTVKLNKYIPMAYTAGFYLSSVKRYNPAFWPEVQYQALH